MARIIQTARPSIKQFACRSSDSKSLDFAPMKPISQIRRERLLELVRQEGSQVAVADKIIKNKNQIYQWLLPEGAEGARNIGPRSARQLETAFSKPKYWMDTDPEAFNGVSEPSHNYDVRQSYAERLDPATIRTVHEMLRWRFEFEGQKYDIEAAPELFSLAYQVALSGSDQDRSALKSAVDAELRKGAKGTDERRDEEPTAGTQSDTAKRSRAGR
jgi:hypothetical protein